MKIALSLATLLLAVAFDQHALAQDCSGTAEPGSRLMVDCNTEGGASDAGCTISVSAFGGDVIVNADISRAATDNPVLTANDGDLSFEGTCNGSGCNYDCCSSDCQIQMTAGSSEGGDAEAENDPVADGDPIPQDDSENKTAPGADSDNTGTNTGSGDCSGSTTMDGRVQITCDGTQTACSYTGSASAASLSSGNNNGKMTLSQSFTCASNDCTYDCCSNGGQCSIQVTGGSGMKATNGGTKSSAPFTAGVKLVALLTVGALIA